MDRRRFLELLGMASVGATVAYSFPSVIVPKHIIVAPVTPAIYGDGSGVLAWYTPQVYMRRINVLQFRRWVWITKQIRIKDGALPLKGIRHRFVTLSAEAVRLFPESSV